MEIKVNTPEEFISNLPEERKEAIENIRKAIKENLPEGYSETISNGMLSFVVPHSVYPAGYHCDPKQPLPFISIASQKNNISLYHNGIYANKKLLEWFEAEYPKHAKTKLNMGKGCIRFRNMQDIPYDLIGALAKKMSPQQWIDIYESTVKKR